jgi:hypothetical protein
MARGQKAQDTEGAQEGLPEVALKDEAIAALRSVLREEGASAAARVSAARTILEMTGDVTGGAQRSAHEMSDAEISAEIAKLKGGKSVT